MQTDLKHNVITGSSDKFRSINTLPDDPRLQTFLLDSKHQVILLGNPSQSKGIRKTYLDYFNSIKEYCKDSDNYEVTAEFDFGVIRPNEEVNHDFHIKNTNQDTVKVKELLSSCECVTTEISSKIIAPGDSCRLSIFFRDSVTGDFLRSVTVKFEDSVPNKIIEISGIIK